MTDLGRRIRVVMDELTHPTDLDSIVARARPRSRMATRRALVWAATAGGLAVVTWVAMVVGIDSSGPSAGDEAVVVSTSSTGEGGTPANSPEGHVAWTPHVVPGEFRVHTLTVVGDRVFGLAFDEVESPDGRTRLWVSTDGSSWNVLDIDAARFGMRAGYFQQIAQVGNRYLGIVKGEPIDGDLADTRLVVSDDSVDWRRIDTGDGVPLGVAGGDIGGIALIRFDDPSARYRYEILHSTDGVTWASASPPVSGRLGPGQKVELIAGTFYMVAALADQPVALLASSDGSDWAQVALPGAANAWFWLLPGGIDQQLAIYAGSRLGPELWLRSRDGAWSEVSPDGFDGRYSNAGLGDPFVTSSRGGPAIVVSSGGPGRQERGEDPTRVEPGTIWLTTDGHSWTEISGSEDFEPDGYIDLAATLGEIVVIIHRSYQDHTGTVWTGSVAGDDATPMPTEAED